MIYWLWRYLLRLPPEISDQRAGWKSPLESQVSLATLQETTRVIDQRPIWEGRVELTHKQAHTCNTVGLFKFVREVRPYWTM